MTKPYETKQTEAGRGSAKKSRSWRINERGKRRLGAAAILTLTLVLMWAVTLPSAADSGDVKITIDGVELKAEPSMGAPFIDQNRRTQVPLNAAMSAIGAQVSWNAQERIAIVEKDGVRVEVPIGESYIIKNGQRIDNDTAAIIKDRRTYLPIRVVMEAFGASVGWDSKTRTVSIVTAQGDGSAGTQTGGQGNGTGSTGNSELRAMWISYLEFLDMPKEEAAFCKAVDTMMDRCVSYGMNAVIVQVRADSDAMYDSQLFPWSKFASGTQGVSPGYDPTAYMIEAAHQRGLEFHAWINPYRITGYKMSWNEVSQDNPAYRWRSDGNAATDRYVLLHNGFYYYNPSIPEVRQLVVDGVSEILESYDVDGIHFDDYFYPSLNDSSEEYWFDKPEYDRSGSSLPIAQWRRENVNALVREVYRTVKAKDAGLQFGISPAGNVSNLRSNSNHFVDIDTWMSKDGYIDYIMPQLYWGFETKTAQGEAAPYAYESNLKTWIALKRKGNVKLYIGLNVANAGSAVKDNNAVSEWLRYDDILARQVSTARNSGEVSGFAFFRYGVFQTTAAQKEVNNLKNVL